MDNIKKLLDDMRAGSICAFEELYHELKTPVFTVIYRMTGSRELSEDILQELFIKFYKNPPGKEIKDPAAWIYRCAFNLTKDRLRLTRREIPEETPPKAVIREDICEKMDIEAALASLPEEMRIATVLHLTAGLTFREIGDILGKSLTDTYRLYRKALLQLRTKLNGGI